MSPSTSPGSLHNSCVQVGPAFGRLGQSHSEKMLKSCLKIIHELIVNVARVNVSCVANEVIMFTNRLCSKILYCAFVVHCVVFAFTYLIYRSMYCKLNAACARPTLGHNSQVEKRSFTGWTRAVCFLPAVSSAGLEWVKCERMNVSVSKLK